MSRCGDDIWRLCSYEVAAVSREIEILTNKRDYLDHPLRMCYNILSRVVLSLARWYKMSINYDKLWHLLIDKKMNRTALKEASGISFNVLAKMGKGEAVSMESMIKVCKALDCGIADVMEIEK
jgi:DNA (cytosine-5)-methyltransferase 1